MELLPWNRDDQQRCTTICVGVAMLSPARTIARAVFLVVFNRRSRSFHFTQARVLHEQTRSDHYLTHAVKTTDDGSVLVFG